MLLVDYVTNNNLTASLHDNGNGRFVSLTDKKTLAKRTVPVSKKAQDISLKELSIDEIEGVQICYKDNNKVLETL